MFLYINNNRNSNRFYLLLIIIFIVIISLFIYSNFKLDPFDHSELDIKKNEEYVLNKCKFDNKDYDKYILDKSISYKGTSYKIRQKLKKAINGNKIKIGVLGGSISTGHTLENPLVETYHSNLFYWWNETFPHNDNEIVNGALPATGSSYFTYCYNKHLPNDLDIIFIEFSINDGSVYPTERGNGDPMITKNMEQLIRSLLQLPNEPAIILISFFSFQVDYYFNGQEAHLPIANYYDLPYISFKNVFFDYLNRNPENVTLFFSKDKHHPNKNGHKIMSNIIINYLEEQICSLNYNHENNFQIYNDLPLIDMWTARSKKDKFYELNPMCYTFNDEKYRPYDIGNWYLLNWKKEKFYIAADNPGDKITFLIETNKGIVYLYVLKSNNYNLGNIFCWIDDDKENGKEILGYWNISRSIGQMILVSENLKNGKHMLYCEVLKKSDNPNNGTHFRIIAVFTG